jgi:putative drug exporter of the RND superfamily
VGLHFKSPGPPLIALAAARISFTIAIRVVGRLAQVFGLALPEELEPLIVVLLLGIVTDYSIFFLSGMQSACEKGFPLTRRRRAPAETS